jgi:hypothetical protein
VRRQRGEHVRRSNDTPTLRDFAADWMDRRTAAGLSEATLKTNGLIFDKHLDPYLGGLRVGDLSPRRLDEWCRELEAAGASTYMLNAQRRCSARSSPTPGASTSLRSTLPVDCRPCAGGRGGVGPLRPSRSRRCAPASLRVATWATQP